MVPVLHRHWCVLCDVAQYALVSAHRVWWVLGKMVVVQTLLFQVWNGCCLGCLIAYGTSHGGPYSSGGGLACSCCVATPCLNMQGGMVHP